MRAPLVVANWKMNGSLSMLDKMIDILRKNSGDTSCQVVICPPHDLLSHLKKMDLRRNRLNDSDQLFITQSPEFGNLKSFRF